MLLPVLVILFSLFPILVVSQAGPSDWTASPFNPPALPLAVRSPYFNVWLAQGNNPPTPFAVDTNPWVMYTATGWYASVVVDDKQFRLLGKYFDGEGFPNQTAVEFTATRTSFLMSANGVQFNMSFLSPIEPKNLTLQSLPFAYMYLTAESIDGQEHRVKMYSDIQGTLIAGDSSKVIQWDSEDTSDYVVLSMRLRDEVPFVENNIHPQDATAYYSFKKIEGATISWSIANIDKTRGVFVGNPSGGNLNNQADPASTFRAAASGSDTPVMGIAIDWGNITLTPQPAVWALGVIRNPSIQYLTPMGEFENRSPYFASAFKDQSDAAKFVLDDFPRALSAAQSLDDQIRTDGEGFSSDYADLLALSARQAMGAMDITIPPVRQGVWNTSDIKIFQKNMGSVGSDNETIASVNNVDALYAAFPIFLYLNPDIGAYLLAPLLEYQNSFAYGLPYAAKNIGTAYPSATANSISDPHIYGVDATANMIIMTLAYSLASGNSSLIIRHYDLLRNWGDYLEDNAITPFNQSSGDFSINSDFIRANQSNLALKGIIAIEAMSSIAEVAGQENDQLRFHETATSAMELWQDQTVSSSQANFVYGSSDTSAMIYDLYADKLLRLNLVPDSVYTLLTGFYQNRATFTKYGLPLNSSPNQNTTTNWMMFAASTTTSSSTRNFLISQIHDYASNNLNNVPFTSVYDPKTGLGGPGTSAGINSPAQGGMFALLALNTTRQTISLPPTEPSPSASSISRKSHTGVIAGSVAAGVAIIGIVIFLLICRRRKLQKSRGEASGTFVSSMSLHRAASNPHLLQPFVSSPPTSEMYETIPTTSSSVPVSRDPPSSSLLKTGDSLQTATQPSGAVPVVGHGNIKRELAGMNIGGSYSVQTNVHDEGSGISATDRTQNIEALRTEVDTLRREMEHLREERLASVEAPPLYSGPI